MPLETDLEEVLRLGHKMFPHCDHQDPPGQPPNHPVPKYPQTPSSNPCEARIEANAAIIWPGEGRQFETDNNTDDHEYWICNLLELCGENGDWFEPRTMTGLHRSAEFAEQALDRYLAEWARRIRTGEKTDNKMQELLVPPWERASQTKLLDEFERYGLMHEIEKLKAKGQGQGQASEAGPASQLVPEGKTDQQGKKDVPGAQGKARSR